MTEREELEQLRAQARYEELLAKSQGQQTAPQPTGPRYNAPTVIANTLMSAPRSAWDFGSTMVDAAMSPVETAQGAYGLVEGAGNKLGRLAADLTTPYTPNEFGQNAEIMPERREDAPNAMGQFFSDRYGSVDKAMNTLQTDPVGLAADISGAISPFSPRAATAINPLNVAARGVANVGKAIPESLPRGLYDSAVKFSTTLDDADKTNMIETALEHGLKPSPGGTAKLAALTEKLKPQIDALIADASASGYGVPVETLFRNIEQLKRKKGGILINSADDMNAIDGYVEQLKEAAFQQGKTHYTVADLQKLKLDFYDQTNFDAMYKTGTPVQQETYKALGRGARETIAEEVPGVDPLNEQLGSLLELKPHLQRSSNRIQNRQAVGLGDMAGMASSAGAGTLLGSPAIGAASAVLYELLNNPRVSPSVAMVLEKVRRGGPVREKMLKYIANNPSISEAALIAYLEDISSNQAPGPLSEAMER